MYMPAGMNVPHACMTTLLRCRHIPGSIDCSDSIDWGSRVSVARCVVQGVGPWHQGMYQSSIHLAVVLSDHFFYHEWELEMCVTCRMLVTCVLEV